MGPFVDLRPCLLLLPAFIYYSHPPQLFLTFCLLFLPLVPLPTIYYVLRPTLLLFPAILFMCCSGVSSRCEPFCLSSPVASLPTTGHPKGFPCVIPSGTPWVSTREDPVGVFSCARTPAHHAHLPCARLINPAPRTWARTRENGCLKVPVKAL